MWLAFMHHNDEDEILMEVPGPLPLNRRQAKQNCETHSKEHTHG